MTTKQSPGFRIATETFNSMWYNLRNVNQSAYKGALYNLVIVIGIASIVAVCHVFGPFLKPLLWSVLIGAVLFPFKSSMSFALKRWFCRLEEEDTHLMVGIATAPLEALESFGQYLTAIFTKHMRIIIGVAVGLLTLRAFIWFAPNSFFCVMWKQIRWSHGLFVSVLSTIDVKVIIVVILIYLTVIIFFWKPQNSFYFMLIGQTLWVVFVAFGCSFLGAFQVPVFLGSLMYALVGVIYDFKSRTSICEHDTEDGHQPSIAHKVMDFLDVQSFYQRRISLSSSQNEINNDEENNENETDDASGAPRINMKLQVKSSEGSVGGDAKKSQSQIYFKALFLACIATILYKHVWMLFVAVVPIIIYLTNKAIVTFQIKELIRRKFNELTAGIQEWIMARHSAILPVCLPGVLRMNNKVHKAIRRTMKDSIDTVSSIIMIILLLLTVLFAGIFCAVEIYSETITVVQLGNDVINYTIYHRPELMNIFPEGITNSLDDVIENAYQYGRSGIETYVDELLKDADNEQRKHLKTQLLSVWDRMIQYWVDRQKDTTFTGPQVPASAITDSLGEIVNNEALFSAAQQGLIGWVKKNLDILMEVMNSVWLIVHANLNILTSILGTFLSMFLGGGQAVITFIINSIIFLTALFYLLSSSEEKYAPLAAANYLGSSSGQKIAEAIETSISSVLFASAKLALFHGLFTWLTHTIFGARVVFLPAVLAAVLAAVPFLGTYWCSLPAFLDIWLIQDRFSLGIVLLLVHFLFPSSFVDPAIYADVNGGGHAYLTGLSIAGGMFWLGWEGAIFGPILLCLVVVIFNLTSNALKESPSTPKTSSLADNKLM